MKLAAQVIGFIVLLIFFSSFKSSYIIKKNNTFYLGVQQDSVLTDSIAIDSSVVSYTLYKEGVHASYYHDKFNGRKTASGEKFDNNLYTAAHKTLKFGTKLKITNPLNNESVIVTVNDRGPFTKGREIDLSKKAFMDIANCKLPGFLNVTIEIIEE
ncbi:septal ring lytic transglycosylase RlpA family protein [Mariniflexile maritimum]|uniref:septal ring lytic transglycosylase RlpA family protein n=1 Tax=Mariniflexile maritimum TaxID=2682493 RepID=UPI0012F6CC30|nr:septal ring lytic transglycosylase RlpA family protein [Mariniflexile maritimum]